MLVHFDVQSLSKAAEFIIEGRVTKHRVNTTEQQIGNAMRVMFTDHQVRVDNALKRSPFAVGNIITVRTLAGETHERSLNVASEASLLADEEVFLFLSQAREPILHPCKPLLARPILVEADIVRIQVGKDLAAQF